MEEGVAWSRDILGTRPSQVPGSKVYAVTNILNFMFEIPKIEKKIYILLIDIDQLCFKNIEMYIYIK